MAKTYEHGLEDGFNSAIRFVLGYLNGCGDCGGRTYTEILEACGEEKIIASARKEKEMRFTGLDRYCRNARLYQGERK